MRYTSSITAGSLKLSESRALAGVLLQAAGAAELKHAIATDNVLRARSQITRQTLARLIRRRLGHLPPALLRLVRDGSHVEATQACLAGAVMDSPLLGDFLDLALRPLYRTYKTQLPLSAWHAYLEGCHSRDPDMACWSEATTNRLRSSVFRSLTEAGYLTDTRNRQLQAVHLAPPIARELAAAGDLAHYALRCMEVAS